jgi:outer membrane protein assembly factor BamD
MNKFTEARFEYEELIRLFPDYKEIARAYYMLGVCDWEASLPAHYTQEETNSAIASFELFLVKFPLDERKDDALRYIEKCQLRLVEKKYWNGYAYYKIFDYSAAELYFNEIIAKNLNHEIDRKSLYYSCRIHLARENIEKTELFFSKLQVKYPDSKETRKIQTRLERLKKKLAKKA